MWRLDESGGVPDCIFGDANLNRGQYTASRRGTQEAPTRKHDLTIIRAFPIMPRGAIPSNSPKWGMGLGDRSSAFQGHSTPIERFKGLIQVRV